jgi:YVTN family beta-propeller protein
MENSSTWRILPSGTVSVIDTATNTEKATVVLGDPIGIAITADVVGAPMGIAITPDGKSVYVTNPKIPDATNPTILVIDTASNTVVTGVAERESPSFNSSLPCAFAAAFSSRMARLRHPADNVEALGPPLKTLPLRGEPLY